MLSIKYLSRTRKSFTNEKEASLYSIEDNPYILGPGDKIFIKLLGIDDNGNGVFYGFVSLENYGGFTSIRLRKKVQLKNYNKIVLRVFGDNKQYQLRIKTRNRDRHVYVKNFYAESKWKEIEIDLKSMRPQFRGRKLNMSNFNNRSIEEIGILIGNKTEEEFRLLIDYLVLK